MVFAAAKANFILLKLRLTGEQRIERCSTLAGKLSCPSQQILLR